mgnify:CR=1 FL=1
MKLNGSYVWKFLGYDSKRAGYMEDFIRNKKTYENDNLNSWFDITSKVKVGTNELTYFHFTSGPGLYVHLRVTRR